MNDAGPRPEPGERAAGAAIPDAAIPGAVTPYAAHADEPPGATAEGVPARTPGPPGTPGPSAAEDRPGPDGDADPSAPAPLRVPRTPTGDTGVDALLERLADADHLATDGHPEVYEDVHRGLRDALTALDARPGPPAPPPSYGNRS